MNSMKPLLVFMGPVGSRSGYGDHSVDLVRSLLTMDKFDIKVIPTNWGMTPMNDLDSENERDTQIASLLHFGPLERQPDVFIQCTVPNEFQPYGKYNIGITAGIETTAMSAEWVEGCNRMNLVIVPSNHAKTVMTNMQYEKRDTNTNQVVGILKVERPVEVLFEGIDTTVYKKLAESDIHDTINTQMDAVEEDFAFLFVGHWLNGDFTHDRKDVGGLIHTFLTTFADMENQPALVLKSSSATFSITDRESILEKIRIIKDTISKDKKLPNVYLLHGQLTRDEMNSLYNHPKVKAMVSFTKGEGFGRPMLEYLASGKPLIASAWSGQLDFIDKTAHTLLAGKIQQIHPSAVWKNVLIPESGWFYVDYKAASKVLLDCFTKYKDFKYKALNSEKHIMSKWSLEAMTDKFKSLLDTYIGAVPTKAEIKLPKLVRVK